MRNIKKMLLFLLLKVIELSIIFLIPYLIGKTKIAVNIFSLNKEHVSVIGNWLMGILVIFFGIVLLVGGCFIIFIVLQWINFNWKIVNKGKGIYWIEKGIP